MFSLLYVLLILISITFTSSFEVYWNVPSVVCKTNYEIYLNLTQYGIIQNEGDEFYGDAVVLMYETGRFPYFDNKTGTPVAINGGIPQLGNLTLHLETLRPIIEYRIPDVNFTGLGILDMEYWRPIYRQNFFSSSSLSIYQNKSKELEQQLHPDWTSKQIELEAERRFEQYARLFMEKTLEFAREMRPHASWGYYIFPMCFNGLSNQTLDCPEIIKTENDKLKWLYDASDALFPSSYLGITNTEWHNGFVSNKVGEAIRVAKNMNSSKGGKPRAPKVFSYTWYRYYEGETYLYVDDILNSFAVPRALGANGVVIWGSTGDLSTKEKCERFSKYVSNTFGPLIQHISSVHSSRLQDLVDGKCMLFVSDGKVIDNCMTDMVEVDSSSCVSFSFIMYFTLIIVRYLS